MLYKYGRRTRNFGGAFYVIFIVYLLGEFLFPLCLLDMREL